MLGAGIGLVLLAALSVGLVMGAGGGSEGPSLAPTFQAPRLGGSGPPVSLAALRGKPVVLNFFASWCDPCRTELPLLAATDRSLGGRASFVGVDVSDQTAPAVSLLRTSGVTYTIATDESYRVSGDEYHLFGLPATVFIDPGGREVGRVTGPLTSESLGRWLSRLGLGNEMAAPDAGTAPPGRA